MSVGNPICMRSEVLVGAVGVLFAVEDAASLAATRVGGGEMNSKRSSFRLTSSFATV